METKIIKIDQDNLDHKLRQEAGEMCIRDRPITGRLYFLQYAKN